MSPLTRWSARAFVESSLLRAEQGVVHPEGARMDRQRIAIKAEVQGASGQLIRAVVDSGLRQSCLLVLAPGPSL